MTLLEAIQPILDIITGFYVLMSISQKTRILHLRLAEPALLGNHGAKKTRKNASRVSTSSQMSIKFTTELY
jgi:hypothetical protein